MRIAFVSYYDNVGGAGKAAFRLFEKFHKEGHDVKMFVIRKVTSHENIEAFSDSTLERKNYFLERLLRKIYKLESLFSFSYFSNKKLIEAINEFQPDIVNLHWISKGMFDIKDIQMIKAPIFWSMHDMFPVTGGCHFSNGCKRFENKCGKCPILGSKSTFDLSRFQYLRKKKLIDSKQITFIGLSKWLAGVALNSNIVGVDKSNVINLPNLLDIDFYKPLIKEAPRKPNSNYLNVLFTAMSGTRNPRKGFDLLTGALEFIDNEKVKLLIVGNSIPQNPIFEKFKIEKLLPTNDDNILLKYYNMTDIVVVPSREENFSNVIFESMATGAGVIAFNIGGNSDFIQHKKNGYLVPKLEKLELAKGIKWMVKNLEEKEIGRNARVFIEKELGHEDIYQEYRKHFFKRSNKKEILRINE